MNQALALANTLLSLLICHLRPFTRDTHENKHETGDIASKKKHEAALRKLACKNVNRKTQGNSFQLDLYYIQCITDVELLSKTQ